MHTDLEQLKNNLIKRLELELSNEEGLIKDICRKAYRNKKEFNSFRLRIVLSIDKGNWFKNTITYDLYTDELIDFISLKKGNSDKIHSFNKTEMNSLFECILDDLNKNKA